MNNLLRTLTESQAKPTLNPDLRLLLTTVKEGRRQISESKLTDPFYDSLEGLLQDLRTVSIDNHDAEAFLKPVLKTEVPDYYDVISNPMDLQTMLKKVKSRQYKTKKEFKDDLDLIWSNCFTYNASENHPLRKCAQRLKIKAEKLLQNITDPKERFDPIIPPDHSSTGLHIKLNGINGRAHTRSPSLPTKPPTITIKSSTPLPGKSFKPQGQRKDVPFADSPALVRTAEGMATFRELERGLEAGPSSLVADRLRQLAPFDVESDYEDELASTGDKRKMNGVTHDHPRPHKRARFNTLFPVPVPAPAQCATSDDLTQVWWGAVQSNQLLPNGLPEIPYASSSRRTHTVKSEFPVPNSIPQPAKRKKRRKKPTLEIYRPEDHPKALLTLMNNNIRTIKRVRHTHAKFSALGLTKDGGGVNEDGEGAGAEGSTFFGSAAPSAGVPGAGFSTAGINSAAAAAAAAMDVDDVLDDQVDERPWEPQKRRGVKVGGIELGERNADDCLRWMNGKVLEHAGFQGASTAALDVLTGVASEYLFNVGRTIKYLTDKFANVMSPEEIILHTLFESGTSRIQDLERYIKDDVERYGSRLGDLEKKLVGAYREVTAVDTLEDEGLFVFEDEEEDEASALALGDFADTLGVDYFGLRELGIADEFGMTSLTIPKKLLKGKKKQNPSLPAIKPTEPPLPYPPPPPFIPLTAAHIPEQIGLLQSFYQSRIHGLAPTPLPPFAPPLSGPTIGNSYPVPPLAPPMLPGLAPPPPLSVDFIPQMHIPPSYAQQLPPQVPIPPPDTVIPDDAPQPAQVKMGPLGQIVKTGSSYPSAKKKAKAAAAVTPAPFMSAGAEPPSADPIGDGVEGVKAELAGAAADGSVVPNGVGGTSTAKKKKGATGVGSGNGRKKKLMEAAHAQEQAQVQAHAHGQAFPPVVTASA